MPKNFPRLVIIGGPTCSGKSSLAVELALLLGGEIINADSMQVYRGMDIGTAKLPMRDRKGIPHHLIDIVEPDQEFNAALFIAHSLPIIENLYKKRTPIIIVGGTGLYVRALLGGLFECHESDKNIRKKLAEECKEEGLSSLYKRLKRVDTKAAETINPMDRVRVIRALEVIELTGYRFSDLAMRHGFSDRRFRYLYFCLDVNRAILYERINNRTESMIEYGLIDEVEGLLKAGFNPQLKSMQSIGYRHIVDFLDKKYNLDETKRHIKRDTRRYAKRQFTWFKGDPEVIWVDLDNKQEIFKRASVFAQKLDL